jgi:FkbM family methyltransferase
MHDEHKNVDTASPKAEAAPGTNTGSFMRAQTVEDAGDGLRLFTFPGGFRCYSHSSEDETTLIYNEIFVKQEYLGTTLSLDAGRYVFDVGANIGLFALFAKLRNPGLTVHAFEPIKATYEVLVRNIALHGLADVHAHNYALGVRDGAALTMTYYPHAAGNATAHPETKVALQRTLTDILGPDLATYLFDAAQVQTVPTRTLSAVIDQMGVPAIDLLKIDTESDELAVLQGIADVHYPLIRQMAIEAHGSALQAEIEQLLTTKGFTVSTDAGIAVDTIVHASRTSSRCGLLMASADPAVLLAKSGGGGLRGHELDEGGVDL